MRPQQLYKMIEFPVDGTDALDEHVLNNDGRELAPLVGAPPIEAPSHTCEASEQTRCLRGVAACHKTWQSFIHGWHDVIHSFTQDSRLALLTISGSLPRPKWRTMSVSWL